VDATALEDALRSLVIPWEQTPAPPASATTPSPADRPIGTVVMPMLDRAAIGAASPGASRALRRFEETWSRGRGMRRDFYDLVRELHHAGCTAEAEYLLRSNLLLGDDDGLSLSVDGVGLALYRELFGTARREEFAAAIRAFVARFSAPLTGGAGGGFFVGYETAPGAACLGRYRLRGVRCAVHFEYASRDHVEAQLWSLADEDQLLHLRCRGGVWEISGAGVCCRVSEGGSAEPSSASDPARGVPSRDP
jgi:hypothetical protein